MNQDLQDAFLRFSRRNLTWLLFLVILLGGTVVALTLSPRGAVSLAATRVGWLLPVLIAIVVGVQSSRGGRKWTPSTPEVKAILEDEWRVTNMSRASRMALVVTLAAQWPLAIAFGFFTQLPPPRVAMGMAAASITVGLATLLALFLFFDRE